MALSGQSIGGEILVYIDGTAIAYTKNATLTADRDFIASITKSSSANWEGNRPSTQRWSVDYDGLFVYAAAYGVSDIFALQIAGTKVSVKFSPNTSGNKYFHGNAYFSGLTMEAPDEGNTSFSGSLIGTDALAEASLT